MYPSGLSVLAFQAVQVNYGVVQALGDADKGHNADEPVDEYPPSQGGSLVPVGCGWPC